MRFNPFDFRVASNLEKRAVTDRLSNQQLSDLYARGQPGTGDTTMFGREVKVLFGAYAPPVKVMQFLRDELRNRRQQMADEAVTGKINWLDIPIENLRADAYMAWRQLFGESYALDDSRIRDAGTPAVFSRAHVARVLRSAAGADPTNRQVFVGALMQLHDGRIGALYRLPSQKPVSFVAESIGDVVSNLPKMVADALQVGDVLGQLAFEASMLTNPRRQRRFAFL